MGQPRSRGGFNPRLVLSLLVIAVVASLLLYWSLNTPHMHAFAFVALAYPLFIAMFWLRRSRDAHRAKRRD